MDERYLGSVHPPWLGNICVDRAEDDFFDATPDTPDDIPGAKTDFITVMLHEMRHLLGIGAADAFKVLVINGQFTGAHAVAANGGPVLLSSDGAHVDESVLSGGKRALMDNGDSSRQ